MKRFVCCILICAIFLTTGFSVFAQGTAGEIGDKSTSKRAILTYDDGSYCVTTITETLMRSTKSGTKTHEYYSSDDVIQWKVQVNGTFTYNGITSSCTKASHKVTIYNDAWYVYSQNSYKSGNKAIADVTMKKKFLGVVTATRDVHLELSCDKNGNLS